MPRVKQNLAEQILDEADDATPIKQGAGIAGYGKAAPVPVAEPEPVHGYVPTDRPKTFRFDLDFLAALSAFSKKHGIPQKQILQRAAWAWMEEYTSDKETTP